MLGRPTIWISVGQGPAALAVGAGGGCLDIFTLIYPFSPLSPSLWETARYRLKYCLKGPLNSKQPTNQFFLPFQWQSTLKGKKNVPIGTNSFFLKSKFFPLRIDPIMEGFIIQGSKQDVTNLSPFEKIEETYGGIPGHGCSKLTT